jgi:hypothetical protein
LTTTGFTFNNNHHAALTIAEVGQVLRLIGGTAPCREGLQVGPAHRVYSARPANLGICAN